MQLSVYPRYNPPFSTQENEKFFLNNFLLCSLDCFTQQDGLTKEQFDEMVDNFLADCASQEGANADDISYLKVKGNMPTNKGQMCLVACVGENLGFVKNGKEDIESSIKTVESVLGPDHSLMPAVREIAAECGDVALPDRCESSTAVYQCAQDGAKKRNFNLDDVI